MDSREGRRQGYTISPAESEYIPLLNDIEVAAATIFPPGLIPAHILNDKLPLKVLWEARDKDMLWVALDAAKLPVGYALLEIVDGLALLAQMDVHPDHGQRGIGAALGCRVIKRVREMGLNELFLTTFSHVKWNGPFYEKLGFRILGPGELPRFLDNILRKERERGLDNRVAMKLSIRP